MFLSCYLFPSLWFHRYYPIELYINIVCKNIMLFYYITWLYNLVFITILYIFTFFLLILFSINFLLFSHILSWNVVILSLSSFIFFLIFLAPLLYIDESLWFLKFYFGFIHVGVVFFSFSLQVAYFSLL